MLASTVTSLIVQLESPSQAWSSSMPKNRGLDKSVAPHWHSVVSDLANVISSKKANADDLLMILIGTESENDVNFRTQNNFVLKGTDCDGQHLLKITKIQIEKTAFDQMSFYETPFQMSTPINELPDESVQNVEDDNMIHEIMASLNSEIPADDTGSERRTERHRDFVPREPEIEAAETRPVLNEYKRPSPSLVHTIWKEAKRPLLVLLLFFAFSLQIVDTSLLKALPKLARESGNLGLLGLLIKGVLCSILFFILTKII